MKNSKYIYLIFPLIIITYFGIITIENFKKEDDISFYENTQKKDILFYYNDTVHFRYKDLMKKYNSSSEFLNYSVSLEQTVKKMINEDKELKMYPYEDLRVLEAVLDKEEANAYFGDYRHFDDDIKLKIYFDKDDPSEEINNIDFEINKEEILRERMVKTAQEQVENTGEKYWNWYGYNHRVEWCCVFVSWVAHQHGLIEAGEIPKFVRVRVGVKFFKDKNQWKYSNEYTPKPGDVVFFDWNDNEIIDHVGLVEKVENGYVYTIEGNVSYKWVKRKKYKLNSSYLYGYGIPDYTKVVSESY